MWKILSCCINYKKQSRCSSDFCVYLSVDKKWWLWTSDCFFSFLCLFHEFWWKAKKMLTSFISTHSFSFSSLHIFAAQIGREEHMNHWHKTFAWLFWDEYTRSEVEEINEPIDVLSSSRFKYFYLIAGVL